jgi:radical SAM protein (TIGR01212 family)
MFGERVQKISLDAGFTCPNRDGTLSDKGCFFCDPRGSGTGAYTERGFTITEQISRSRKFIHKRYHAKKFIAYFQSFTNTYAPLSRLKRLYDMALAHQDMVGLAVGTRPDCINSDTLKLLNSYTGKYLVWVEYGLQSAHDCTLKLINRGHDVACFKDSVLKANEYGLNVCAHVILGLPREDRKMMMQTASFLAQLPVQGIKIHLLYVVEGTPLAQLYRKGVFRTLEREEYIDLVVEFMELLPPDMVIQRLTGDPVKLELISPMWAKEKSLNLKLIHESFERRNTWQGKQYQKFIVADCK